MARLEAGLESPALARISVIVFLAAGFVLVSVILTLVVRLCGKKLTVRKVMNLLGYAKTPYLLASLITLGILLSLPAKRRLALSLGLERGPLMTALMLFQLVAATYSLVLLIRGLAASRDERIAAAEAAEAADEAEWEEIEPESPAG